ncbi:MAG: hypothetical protein EOO62_39665 [Hymenobacter sp.]|nr:MAG: hypothetical protein EOO62_39665 [Hymenobacter sp.]
MKKQFLFLTAVGLGHSTFAQILAPPQAATIALDTVAVSGRVRQLSLLPPGEKPSAVVGLAVSPGHRVAVRYQPPSPEHAYDIRSVTLHFNTLFNQSSAGSLHVQLALADSSGAPSATYLLPAPFVITDKQVRRAPHHTITLAVRGSGLGLAKNGVFVVLTGAPSSTERFVADTVIAEKRGKHQQVAYVKVQDLRTGAYRLISNADFLTLPVAHTTELPVTWSFWQRDKQWHRAPLTLPQAPHYQPHNYWVELGVTEL